MRKIFLWALALISLLTCGAAFAVGDEPYIHPSQVRPWMGYIRKAPCGTGAGDACGSNPPTWHLTPDACGIMISTGAARNADGVTFSTDGDRYTLPTVAELTAAGMGVGSGAAGSLGYANREAQCSISFVMGAPGPSNWLRVGIDGVQGVDKVTPFGTGAFDIFYGDLTFPYGTPNLITFTYNGNSWIVTAATPGAAEQLWMGQMSSHGNGRLFQVTTDPTWWTAGTLVGKLAFCPFGGRGMVTPSNGGFQLSLFAATCVFRDNITTSTVTDYISLRSLGSSAVTGISAGAAYLAGTAQNGVAYGAGNYTVLIVGTAVAYASGNVVYVHNVPTTLGTKTEGAWIGKQLVAGVDPGCAVAATCIELHEQIDIGNGIEASNNVAPPSSFVAGDTMRAGVVSPVAFSYHTLTTNSINTARRTNPVTGTEDDNAALHNTIVGVARREVGIGYSDTSTKRFVASYHNPVEKRCQSVTGADRTTASLVFVEVNADIRCQFIFMTGIPASSTALGDTGRRVRYLASVGSANNTGGDGCEYAIGFGVGAGAPTAETEIAGFVNPAGVTGGRFNVAVNGQKVGLAEVAQTSQYITLMHRAVTGGTCTTFSGSTVLNAYIWQ